MPDPAISQNRRAIGAFYGAVLNGGQTGGLETFVAPDYVPHVPHYAGVPNLAPGILALQGRLADYGRLPNTVERMAGDGEHVYVQVLYETTPAVNAVDIFRLDAAHRIAEHWNIRQKLTGESAETIAHRFAGPGDGTLDVPPRICARNAQRAHALYRDVWSKGDADLALQFYATDYLQHNPHIQSGAQRIRDMIATDIQNYMKAHDGAFPVHVHHIGAQGDLVFGHFEIAMAGLGRNDGVRSTVVDIFRVDEDGKFAEHWDVCQMESDGLPEITTLF